MFCTQGKLNIYLKLILCGIIFVAVCLLQALLVEPRNNLDHILHIHDGKLPDLEILEDQEPVDAILRWAKVAAKEHHPIVREPIYWDIIEKTCLDVKYVACKRKRAWEYIDMGAITSQGLTYDIEFYNPIVDPYVRPDEQDRVIEDTAVKVCRRIIPPLDRCKDDLIKHISVQLHEFESKRLDNKNVYTKLALEMDAPQSEIFPGAAAIIRSKGTNLSPFKRVDNGTVGYPKWDRNAIEAYHIMDAHEKLKDNESRTWYDKPCTPYFGGALCAKTDKDGNMIIEV